MGVWPLMRKVMTGQAQDYLDKLVGLWTYVRSNVIVRFCGSQEQRSKIAAQREKEKARVKRNKEKARNSKQTKPAMREARGREDDIAKQDASKHSELQPDPLPAALDMRIDKPTRSAREPVLLLPDRLPVQEVVAQERNRQKVTEQMHWSSLDLVLGGRQVGFFSPPTQQGQFIKRLVARGEGGASVEQNEIQLAPWRVYDDDV